VEDAGVGGSIILKWVLNMVSWGCAPDSSFSPWRSIEGCCELGSKPYAQYVC